MGEPPEESVAVPSGWRPSSWQEVLGGRAWPATGWRPGPREATAGHWEEQTTWSGLGTPLSSWENSHPTWLQRHLSNGLIISISVLVSESNEITSIKLSKGVISVTLWRGSGQGRALAGVRQQVMGALGN